MTTDETAERQLLQATIAEIARKHLQVETLETRASDSLDFHDVAVWSIESALTAAYAAGREHYDELTARVQALGYVNLMSAITSLEMKLRENAAQENAPAVPRIRPAQ